MNRDKHRFLSHRRDLSDLGVVSVQRLLLLGVVFSLRQRATHALLRDMVPLSRGKDEIIIGSLT